MTKILPALALIALLAACHPAARVCETGKPLVLTQLFFGLAKKDGAVTQREWQYFVSTEIAPRFPEGFTIVEGHGFWLSEEAKKTISENSKVVSRLHDGSDRHNQDIQEIIGIYKQAFGQEAVLRIDTKACAAF